MERLKEKKITVITAIVGVIVVVGLLVFFIFGGNKKEEAPSDTDREQTDEVADENNLESESDSLAPDGEDDIFTLNGLPHAYTLESSKDMLNDYREYLKTVEPLLNGLNVGFSVMNAVFANLAGLTDAEALKADFFSSETEYTNIFTAMEKEVTTANTEDLNSTLLGLYKEMYDLRKAEANALVQIGDKVEIDYTKVNLTQEEIQEKYQNILDLQAGLTDITGVYIGDGMGLQQTEPTQSEESDQVIDVEQPENGELTVE